MTINFNHAEIKFRLRTLILPQLNLMMVQVAGILPTVCVTFSIFEMLTQTRAPACFRTLYIVCLLSTSPHTLIPHNHPVKSYNGSNSYHTRKRQPSPLPCFVAPLSANAPVCSGRNGNVSRCIQLVSAQQHFLGNRLHRGCGTSSPFNSG